MARPRLRAILTLLAVTPAGFVCKFYAGPGRVWFNVHPAGAVYEIFWILVVFAVWPTRRVVKRAPVVVFATTCALEALQLWHPPLLERLRATFLGAAILGTSFDWLDFPHYAAGCLAGWALLRFFTRKQDPWRAVPGQ